MYLVNLKRILFVRKMSSGVTDNLTLVGILNKYVNFNEFQTVLHKFNIDPCISEHNIRHCFRSHFANSCLD